MTERLYYEDAYLKEFTASVVEIKNEAETVKIRLDRTAFYPEGGGQGADTGILETLDGNKMKVIDVQEEGGEVWHYICPAFIDAQEPGDGDRQNKYHVKNLIDKSKDMPEQLPEDKGKKRTEGLTIKISEGMQVHGKIDWERRFDHMQQHSGEHIVSGMICSRFNCDNVGFHMGEDVVTIDYSTRISYEQILEIEEKANQYIWEDHQFTAFYPTAEELEKLEYRSKKELEGDVRIARFPGADTCACCGLHVSGSAQVGLVKFISSKPFHEGSRLELLCGKRAMDYLSMNHRVNKAAAVLMSTSEENTADRVEKLIAENVRLKSDASLLEDRLFSMWAESFRGKENALVIDDQLTAIQGRELADRIADCCSGMVAVFTKKEKGYQYAVIKRESDITDFIKAMNIALDGRGGGRSGFAQGSVTANKREIENYWQGRF